ncbi:hypothetical protein DF3PA_200051 [Candidatus Defluviicoccus seviourii]|uniref:Uncharacterized protein n=2 Tax=root TaxID=1 RepID=A0A564WDZ3_9PROT|nr:hypothetical protein DF3PB_550004 [uncultured Defluviicoccus sp.]VUX46369.1 hypothetical protein DF3PA_200051 [Candidatus Defluviicoccus seviourii]
MRHLVLDLAAGSVEHARNIAGPDTDRWLATSERVHYKSSGAVAWWTGAAFRPRRYRREIGAETGLATRYSLDRAHSSVGRAADS